MLYSGTDFLQQIVVDIFFETKGKNKNYAELNYSNFSMGTSPHNFSSL